MDRLFWPEPRKLAAPHPGGPEAAEARSVLGAALARALAPMQDYLASLKRCGAGWLARWAGALHSLPSASPTGLQEADGPAPSPADLQRAPASAAPARNWPRPRHPLHPPSWPPAARQL